MKIVILVMIGCLVANARGASILFEDFEVGNGVTTGPLDGQNGWSVDSGTGDVQTSVVQAGTQALEIAGGSVSKGIATNGTLWMHFHARIAEAPQVEPVVDPANALVAFYVNTNLNLVVLSNGVPVELAAQMPIDTWTRFDIYCDSTAGIWNLAMNGNNVASGLVLVSSNPAEQVMFSNQSATGSYLDSLDIADTEQVGEVPDSDDDGIPDWWEQKHFNHPTDNVEGSAISGNGDLTYEETYIAGLAFDLYDPLLAAWDNGEVAWIPKPSRLHDVEWSPDLVNSNFVPVASDIAWPVDHYVDTVHTNEPTGFYRVNIHL